MASRIEEPLVLHAELGNGNARHDYGDLPDQALARQLAEAHLSLLNTGGGIKSRGTSVNYSVALRALVGFLHGRGITSLTALGVRDVHVFMTMVAHLKAQNAKWLLLRCEELSPGSLHPDVVLFLTEMNRRTWRRGKGTPVPPLSPAEAKRLEEACKSAIRSAEARLARGRELLAKGQRPASASAATTADLLWLLNERGPTSRKEMLRLLGPGAWTPVERAGGWEDLHDLLFPTTHDLVPYALLLGLATGISPESIAGLAVDCTEEIGEGKVRVRWYKARGGGDEADTFSAKGPWSPGQLIQRVAELTSLLRPHAPDDCRVRLFVHRARAHGIRHSLQTAPWQRIELFVEDQGLLDDNGQSLRIDRRALRKTALKALEKAYHGQVRLVAGANQSGQVAADHYMAASEETDLLTNVINSTQEIVIRQARASAMTVLDEREMEALASEPKAAAAKLGTSQRVALKLLNTDEEDVFVAKCKGFLNSPFGKPGQPCPAAVWECLFCKQAVVTPTKLPNILGLLDFIDAQQREMQAEEWVRRYAALRVVITEQVLPRFSDTTIAAAQAARGDIYITPEERAS